MWIERLLIVLSETEMFCKTRKRSVCLDVVGSGEEPMIHPSCVLQEKEWYYLSRFPW